MSLDPSLRTKGSLSGVRSVLNRAERIAKMKENKKYDTAKHGALGLPKTLAGKK